MSVREVRGGGGGGVKRCPRCGETKERAEFNKNARRADGLNVYCKPCRSAYEKTPRQRRRSRLYMLVWMYGVSSSEFEDRYMEQGGRCAACWEPFDFDLKGRRPHVDHDHKTRYVRGLVHRDCNLGIGIAGDDADRLRLWADYLDRARAVADRCLSLFAQETHSLLSDSPIDVASSGRISI